MAKEAPLTGEQLKDKINKKFGAGKICKASRASATSTVPRLSWGIFSLDYATGGGIPIGRVTGIYGPKSSAKTYAALKSVASAQRTCREHHVQMIETDVRHYRCPLCGYRSNKQELCPECQTNFTKAELKNMDTSIFQLVDMGDRELKCPICNEYKPFRVLWMDLEGVWDNAWAVTLGVNTCLVELMRAEYAEQAIDACDRLLRTGDYDFLVIDSLAHLIPMSEIMEGMEKWQQGLQARLMNKFMRKLTAVLNAVDLQTVNRPTILMINQIRMKIGELWGNPEIRPGGRGQEYITSVDVKFWMGKYEKDDVGNTNSCIVNFRCEKNKVGTPMQQGNFRLWLANVDNHCVGSTEEDGVVIGMAKKFGLFGDSKVGWKCFEKTYKTQADVLSDVLTDRNLFIKVRNQLLKMRLGTIEADKDAMNVASVTQTPAVAEPEEE